MKLTRTEKSVLIYNRCEWERYFKAYLSRRIDLSDNDRINLKNGLLDLYDEGEFLFCEDYEAQTDIIHYFIEGYKFYQRKDKENEK